MPFYDTPPGGPGLPPIDPPYYDPSAAGLSWPYAPFIPDPGKQDQGDPGMMNMFKLMLAHRNLMSLFGQ